MAVRKRFSKAERELLASGARTEVAGRAYAEPSVWRDAANGQLHIAVADTVNGGHHAYIVRMSADGPVMAAGLSSGTAPVGEALSTAVGVTRVERESYRLPR